MSPEQQYYYNILQEFYNAANRLNWLDSVSPEWYKLYVHNAIYWFHQSDETIETLEWYNKYKWLMKVL